MTHQELIEQGVRQALGDLVLQNILLRAQITELQAQLDDDGSVPVKQNGKVKTEEHVNGQG